MKDARLNPQPSRTGLLLAVAVTGAALWSVWPNPGTQAQYARVGDAYPDAASDSALRLFDLASLPDDAAVAKAEKMTANWDPRATAPVMELDRITGLSPQVRATLWPALRTGLGLEAAADDPVAGRIEIQHALWSRADREDLPDYDNFKSSLYRQIDPRFDVYFRGRSEQSDIRLDEVQWGGVRRDGIPPLKDPEVVSAGDRAANYLGDDDVVFGVEVNGETRAYPKRILAWHEMVKDHLGGVSINGVYCTLCGAMIVYDTELDGVHYELGTSGFLYRSNKLMYDHATESMWSTTRGEPVIGPLVGQGIRLIPRTVVTTTWGRWKTLHPETKVLTLATGYRRDYGEGVAYHNYFATDRLMFQVPGTDPRLANKAEVLALRFGDDGEAPRAYASTFLRKNPIVHGTRGGRDYVVLTDRSGAHRVYDAAGANFTEYDGDQSVTDAAGAKWTLTEGGLVRGEELHERLASHNAFWFGWYSAHPDTELIGGGG